jgi:hypothetical protein
MTSELLPEPGTVRHFDEEKQEWIEFGPHHPLRSLGNMLATEWWNGEAWQKIWEDE